MAELDRVSPTKKIILQQPDYLPSRNFLIPFPAKETRTEVVPKQIDIQPSQPNPYLPTYLQIQPKREKAARQTDGRSVYNIYRIYVYV